MGSGDHVSQQVRAFVFHMHVHLELPATEIYRLLFRPPDGSFAPPALTLGRVQDV